MKNAASNNILPIMALLGCETEEMEEVCVITISPCVTCERLSVKIFSILRILCSEYLWLF